MKKNPIKVIIALAIATIIFTLDQWSKTAILGWQEVVDGNVIKVTSFFNFILVFNRGVSFGMFSEHNQPLLLILVAMVIVLILLVWLWETTSMATVFSIGFIIGGAVGNVMDRIYYGAVVDFLDFHINNLHWPAFNIADSFIFIGVVVLCVYSMFFEKKF
ncbi:MAG: signal peptidase II [Rickettsiales bacterium]